MGFFDQIGNKRLPMEEKAYYIKITPEGEERLRSMSPNGREFDLLSSVKKLGMATVEELAKDLGYTERNTRMLIREYQGRRLITVV